MDSKEHIEVYLLSLRELTENLTTVANSADDLTHYLHDVLSELISKWSVFKKYRLLSPPLSDSLIPEQTPQSNHASSDDDAGEIWTIPIVLDIESGATNQKQKLAAIEFELSQDDRKSQSLDLLWEIIRLWANSVAQCWRHQTSKVNRSSLSENQDIAIARLQVFEGVFEVMKSIATKPATAEILLYACESIVKAMDGVDHVGIVFNDNAPESGKVVAEYPSHGGIGQEIQLEGTRTYELLRDTSAPVVVNDLEHDDLLGDNREILMSYGIKSVMVLPLIVNDELIGSLGIDALEAPHTFTEDEINVLTAVASQIAVGMQNSQFVEKLQHQSETQQLVNQVIEKLPLRSDLETLLKRTGDSLGQLLGASRYSIHLNINEELSSEIIQGIE